MTVSILHERSEVADCLPLVRCATAMGAGQHSCGAGSCAKRVMPEPMAALHLLGKTTSHSTRLQKAAAKSLVIPQAADCVSNVPARGRPMGAPLLRSDPFALLEVQP